MTAINDSEKRSPGKVFFSFLLQFLLLICMLGADQAAKYAADLTLKGNIPVALIPGILEFNYLENKGAAFGILQDQKIFFVFIAVLFSGIILFVLLKIPHEKKYLPLKVSLIAIMAGALGNMIDRIRYDYVIDFIYFKLINFPIFNVADICVTCATVTLIILLLFVYKEEDLGFLSFKQKKYRKIG